MNSTGPYYPTSAVDQGGPNAWSTPSNVYANDGNTAYDGFPTGGAYGNNLLVTGFSFAIPSTATIKGIVLEISRSGSNAADSQVALVSGATTSSNKASATGYPGALTVATYGSSTDLWGVSWTPAMINSSSFGTTFSAYNTHGGGGASVDYFRITVYWAVGLLPVNLNRPKHHIYKVYNNGMYLGNLPNVVTPFQFSQDINSAGPGNITVTCAISADTAAQPNGGTLTDESGTTLTDEAGNTLSVDGGGSLLGIGGSSALIRNGNQVVVWEYGYYSINGRPMFSGTIEKWQAQYGGGDDTINVLIYHDGQDLDNHILTGPPYAYTVDQQQTSAPSSKFISVAAGPGGGWDYVGQTWTVGTGVTNLGAINLYFNGTANITLNVYSSVGSGTILASTSVAVNTGGSWQTVTLAFPGSLKVTAGSSYFFSVVPDAYQNIYIGYSSANPYAGGGMYESVYSGGGGGAFAPVTGSDLWFQTYSSSGNTTATFTNQDPSTGMLAAVMNDYITKGGLISYNSGSIQATGLSLTAGFNTNTVMEGIKSFLSFAPNGFYWYVDAGTDVLNFKQASATADIKLTQGLHMDSVQIVATIENVKNTILFTGGSTTSGGANLYKSYQDATSISQYGVRLDRQSDNRVTVSTTADAIGTSALAEQKNEQYQTVVTVLDKQMDIGALKVGMIVGFNGFGGFVDSLLSQIVRIDYTPDEATLTLGILPVRLNSAFEEVTRGLVAIQTVANPTTPS